MQAYKNTARNSGVTAFENGPDFIRVRFRGGITYLYTYQSAGKSKVEKMKKLALAGRGLSTYISTEVKEGYAEKQE